MSSSKPGSLSEHRCDSSRLDSGKVNLPKPTTSFNDCPGAEIIATKLWKTFDRHKVLETWAADFGRAWASFALSWETKTAAKVVYYVGCTLEDPAYTGGSMRPRSP